MNNKFLFISHDDTRTGAPILLLSLQRAIKKNFLDVEIHFLIKNFNGSLIDEFTREGITYVLNKPEKVSRLGQAIRKIISIRPAILDKKITMMNLNKYNLILSNTITNGDILELIKRNYKGKVLSYIHELHMASKYFTNNEDVSKVIANSDFFAVPCNAVKQFLISEHKVDEDKISLLPYYVKVGADKKKIKSKSLSEDFLVGGCGTIDWRKGIDLFIQIAFKIKKHLRPDGKIKFVWKGAHYGLEYERIMYDIEKAGLSTDIEVLFADNQTADFFSNIDILMLTSREDPFPLVVLEAASLKVPSICFATSGGAEEFIANDAGIAVPYLEIDGAAASILKYCDDRNLLQEHGYNAYNKLIETYQNDEKISTQFMKLARYLNESVNPSEQV